MANIKDVISAIKKADSWDEFKALVMELEPDKVVEAGLKVDAEPLPEELSDFNKKLQQAVNWNPKENKQ